MNRADRRKHHYIYKISRLDGSGKYYIGMHSTDDLDDGYFGSGTLLSRSIKKYGKEQHSKEVLEFLPTRKALKLREKELVNEELLADVLCMNLMLGGAGGWDHLNIDGQPKHLTKEILGKGFKNLTKEQRQKAYWNGNDKRVATMRNQPGGYNAAKIGCRWEWSDEAKLRNQNKGKGESNSQFGKVWVRMPGEKGIPIRKDQLDEYLERGFILGRKNIG